MKNDTIITSGRRVLEIEAKAIQDLRGRIDANFCEAVDILFRCKGRVAVTGVGKSGIIARKISSTLASTGTPSFFLHAAEGSHGDLGMLTKGDVVLALSNSGETEEILKLLPSIKRMDLPLICLVGNEHSTLAKTSTIVMNVSVREEAAPIGFVPTTSTTAALAMGDAMAVALLEKRGIQAEDFALFHPGGTLGKKLLTKVQDLMRGGSDLPIVYEETPMKEVITEMNAKRLGMTSVLNHDRRLAGVITDGDLRRLLEKTTDFSHLKARDVMTQAPKTTYKHHLAAKAVQLMECHEIAALVVVDADQHVEGVIHLNDILKAGVV
ncbi:MAG: KpsF/GutQ family sugar-phosphate isomerase [Deltaproteobacteria bacterium]|nr:KpsF/GutQ family sugar-phosphate isomerase [Deltaproteobacteria bacterium]MBI2500393.1 KpsF/GutQ family sugar-phosphate isomerase [Deltaproteobacteria bacterium]